MKAVCVLSGLFPPFLNKAIGSKARGMNKFFTMPFFLIFALLIPGGCGGGKNSPANNDAYQPTVTVSKPISDKVAEYYYYTGNTDAINKVDVRARVTGYLTEVNFTDGNDVKVGDVLFKIDPRPYKAVLDRCVAELDRQKALYEEKKANLERAKKLLPSGAISQEDYDQNVAQAKMVAADILAAEAAIESARLNLEFTTITAPIDGRASKANIKVGNLIQPGAGNDAIMTTIVTTDPIYIYFNINERDFQKFQELYRKEGWDVRPEKVKDLKVPIGIGLANEKGYPHTALLDFTNNQLNQETGTILIRAEITNKDFYFVPGMFVRVRIPYGDTKEALLVPEGAITSQQSKKLVFVVNDKDIAIQKEVELGAKVDGMRVIESGIGPNDRIVVNGIVNIRDSMKVKVMESEMQKPSETDIEPPKANLVPVEK